MRSFALFFLLFLSALASADLHLARRSRHGGVARDLANIARKTVPPANFGITGSAVVRGVNLGGWFILESWITPSLFNGADNTLSVIPDEWNYMLHARSQTKARQTLAAHYAHFITEEDFATMAAAGLNAIRLPVPHWAFNGSDAEPYYAYAQKPYISAALLCAKKYGLNVMLDLHTLPGSQNGQDNSGHAGATSFGQNVMDQPRALDALQKIVELYVNDPRYGGIVKSIAVVNEPRIGTNQLTQSALKAYHKAAYDTVRNTVAAGALYVPTIVFSNAFIDVQGDWSTLIPNGEYANGTFVVAENHYQAWAPWHGQPFDTQIEWFCGYSTHLINQTTKYDVMVTEWSVGIETGCTPYSDCVHRTMAQDVAENNNQTSNEFHRRFFEAQAYQFEQTGGWMFWTWKTESVSTWSFKDARIQGWIPNDVSDPTQRVYVPSTNSSLCASTQPLRDVKYATQS